MEGSRDVTPWSAFEHTNPATRIVSGKEAVDRLPELMDDLGVRGALVVCGRTVSEGPQLTLLRAALGPRLAGTFVGVTAHAGLQGLLEGVTAVDEAGADCLISLGGGATIDSAKCIALLRARDAPLEEYRIQKDRGSARRRRVPATMAHLALPTTAGSGSEIMPWAGIRNEETREKMLFRDPSLTPAVAVLDPRLVVPTAPWLTATSGVTALARSVETLYSTARQPIAEALALQSLRLMAAALPVAMAQPGDIAARAATQVAASISGIAADNSMVSLVHAVGHALGGRLALQHGIVHSILLPEVAARYLPTTGALQRQVADALGVDVAGRTTAEAGVRAVEALRDLLHALPIPSRLRDVDVPKEAIEDLAAQTTRDPMFSYVPLDTSEDDVRQILLAAW